MFYATLLDRSGIEVGIIEVPYIERLSQIKDAGHFSYSIKYRATPEEIKRYSHKYRYLNLECLTFNCRGKLYFVAGHHRYKDIVSAVSRSEKCSFIKLNTAMKNELRCVKPE